MVQTPGEAVPARGVIDEVQVCLYLSSIWSGQGMLEVLSVCARKSVVLMRTSVFFNTRKSQLGSVH